MNHENFRNKDYSRYDRWLEERKELMPLPSTYYRYMERKTAKVSSDFHIRFDNAYYSVDKAFLHKKVLIGATSDMVNIYSKVFENPKDEEIISRIIEFCGTNDDDIILDFFSESATTAHGVFLSNLKDGKNRHFILVQEQRLAEVKKEQNKIAFKNNIVELLNQQTERVVDPDGNRWIRCEFCGKIDTDAAFSSYGGKNHMNLGTCKECSDKEKKSIRIEVPKMESVSSKIDLNTCPICGGGLKVRNGKFGEFYGCSNYPKCKYTRNKRK